MPSDSLPDAREAGGPLSTGAGFARLLGEGRVTEAGLAKAPPVELAERPDPWAQVGAMVVFALSQS